MSLDVTIKYKEPRMENYAETHSACGSNMRYPYGPYPYGPELESSWSANITHNMARMASHVPISSGPFKNLYEAVWRPEESVSDVTTDLIAPALKEGVEYMEAHEKELLEFNPSNGWGSYDDFLSWLKSYRDQCLKNPGCEVETGR